MRKSDFSYRLPPHLIAQEPLPERSASRLLTMDAATGSLADSRFGNFPDFLESGDLLIFNDTKVIPARLFGTKTSGGKIEILIERITGKSSAVAKIRASKTPKRGSLIELEGGGCCIVGDRDIDLFGLEFDAPEGIEALLETSGHTPLPPYIDRSDQAADRFRYQTVYAKRPGAVAAPTAGLHFDDALLDRIVAKGVVMAFVTLHVGAGTFQPLRSEDLEEHVMHREIYEVNQDVVELVAKTRNNAKRVIAVGTTSLRALEAASLGSNLRAKTGETDLFIRPGFRFRCVDALLTNFHLPESTLLALVCAFGGFDYVMDAYRHAIRQQYRFYSYGDAMFLTRNDSTIQHRKSL